MATTEPAISRKATISVALLVTVVSVAVALTTSIVASRGEAASGMARNWAEHKASTDRIGGCEGDIDELQANQGEIMQSLGRIEGKLDAALP